MDNRYFWKEANPDLRVLVKADTGRIVGKVEWVTKPEMQYGRGIFGIEVVIDAGTPMEKIKTEYYVTEEEAINAVERHF